MCHGDVKKVIVVDVVGGDFSACGTKRDAFGPSVTEKVRKTRFEDVPFYRWGFLKR